MYHDKITAAPVVAAGDKLKYFENARSWELDRLSRSERSKKVAYVVAGVSATITVFSVVAVTMLTPLKTVIPVIFRVDNATGVVENITSVTDGKWTSDEAVTKASAARYVRTREGYALNEREENFKVVSAFSSPQEQERFAVAYSGKNPDSPQIIYGRSGIARITIKSVAVPNSSLVQVRFRKDVIMGDERKTSHWIATMSFSMADRKKLREEILLLNPTGFVVTDYRVDPESVQ